MNTSHLPALATFALVAATAQGATYTIPGTGLFDQSLGTLESVEVSVREGHGELTMLLGLTHGLTTGSFLPTFTATGLPVPKGTQIDFLPFALSLEGSHTHVATLGTLTTSVGMLVPPPAVVSPSDSHSHMVDFLSEAVDFQSGLLSLHATSSPDGGHTHDVVIPAFSQVLTEDALTPFLSGNPVATFGLLPLRVSPGGAHSHQWVGGSYPAILNGYFPTEVTIPASFVTVSNGFHGHSARITGMGIEQTTFTYDPVPEPACLGVAGLLGAALLGRVRRPTRGLRGAQHRR